MLLQKALVNEMHSPLTGFLSESKSEVPLRMDWSMLVQTRVSLSGPSQCPTPEKKERESERDIMNNELQMIMTGICFTAF